MSEASHTRAVSVYYYRLFRTAGSGDKLGTMIVVGSPPCFLPCADQRGHGRGPHRRDTVPFVSAGGSSLISYYAAMSLCMGIRMRRYVN